MEKRKVIIIVLLTIAFCLATVTAYNGLFNKPRKEDLLLVINEAFDYYRAGGIGNPPVYAYFMEYPEKSVSYEPLPNGLVIPDLITLDSFTLKRPSKFVIARIPLDGYTIYCTIKHLDPHPIEFFPIPAWQVVTVEFVAENE